MKREGSKSSVLLSEKLQIENKTIFVDLKENDGGRFLQIAEISNDRRSTVVIPSHRTDRIYRSINQGFGRGRS